MVLVNLPLEDNWLNRNRQYGIGDESGHLRSYTLEDGLSLAARAGLNIVNWKQVWSHETNYDIQRRDLRRRYLGSAFSGNRFLGLVKAAVHFAARRVRPFGRSLYPSNLFFSARIN